jgi:hypothetical protein
VSRMRHHDSATTTAARVAMQAHYDGRAATYDEGTIHRGLTEEIADWLDDRASGTCLTWRPAPD